MVELLYEESNFAVVRLPGRRFPGVVIQGDSLFTIDALVNELAKCAKAEDAQEIAEELTQIIGPRLAKYERVLKERGIQLPYVRA